MSIGVLRKLREVDEHAERDRVRRGREAQQLSENEAFNRAFDIVRGVYHDAWMNSDMLDIEKRERCWTAIQLLNDLKNQITSAVREGEAARRLLEKQLRQ